ncbi:MAG TPA: alkaline phosphatase family protein [Candidatus Binatus sp.]|uniref:phospholipase C n=1 Tax=Candidatus Binatus sp. TaxID=2811406 RepID=UPI002B49F68B|nr:alkaline phosphatase family protein [Candidatus Binatus sp.]HKN14504.1 alkaline phosphatase family protein [Candidatus Binatus sp.]
MRGTKLLARAVSALAITSICTTPVMARPEMADPGTVTPIQHVVVIFQENVSFDHYFGSYPNAAGFVAQPGTPTVNGLTGSLLSNNPNKNNATNSPQINPFLLDRTQASTCDQDHNYGDEQKAFDMGLMDLFPASVGVGESAFCFDQYSYGMGNGINEGYFDGNTVTAMWNYAQNYALNDNFYGTTFGPSTPGVLNLVAGNTNPATLTGSSTKVVDGTLVGDLDPTGDVCSSATNVQMGGQNIGNLLSAQGLSWGSFMGGFDLTITNPNGTTGCKRSSLATAANDTKNFPPQPGDMNFTADYIPHHAFFQYWASTVNLSHTRPTVPASEYGMFSSPTDAANHNYDIHDFFDALDANNLPAVSFLKAPANMDGHAGYSDPLLEQEFVVNVINAIQNSGFWSSTAVVITWDDSDGWYDHQMSPIVNSSAVLQAGSASNSDQLNGPGKCGNGVSGQLGGIQGRCGYGPRIPMLVISPYAKTNFVDHTLTDQSSIIHFVEDNWGLGRIGGGSFDALSGSIENMFDFTQKVNPGHRHQVFLDPSTGLVTGGHK